MSTKRWIRLVGTHLLHSTSSLAIQWQKNLMNRPFSLSLALSAFPGLCHSVGSYVTDVLSVMLQIFGQCPNMSKSSQSVRSALKNLHSSDLTIYAGDGNARHCCTGSILTESTRSFSNLKLDEICLGIWNDGCLVDWRAILLRFGHAMLHEGHAWNSIPIFNIFHVNPGLFRGKCLRSWLQAFSKYCLITALQQQGCRIYKQSADPWLDPCLACSALATSALLQATGASTWQSCRTPRHHTDKHLKNMLCCATSRNLQEMTTGQYHFKLTSQKNIKFIQIYQRRSKECKSLKQHASEVGNEVAFCQRSQQHGPSCPPNGFSQLSMPTVQ